jgi:hypothetical protein
MGRSDEITTAQFLKIGLLIDLHDVFFQETGDFTQERHHNAVLPETFT